VNSPRLPIIIAVAGFAISSAFSDAGMVVNRTPAITVVPADLCVKQFCRCLEASTCWVFQEPEVGLCDTRFVDLSFTPDAVDGAHVIDFSSSDLNSIALSVVPLVESKSRASDAPALSVEWTACRLPSEFFLATGTEFLGDKGAGVCRDTFTLAASLAPKNRPGSIFDELSRSTTRHSISRKPVEPKDANALNTKRNAKDSRLNSRPDWLPAVVVGSLVVTSFLLLRSAKAGHDSRVASYHRNCDSLNSHRFYTF
jgi:hypothetical protein